MLTVDANVWVAAFDPHDHFHRVAADFFKATAEQGQSFTGPAFLAVEVACALARRAASADLGQRVHHELLLHPLLVLDPLTSEFLQAAARLGMQLGLRAADALYAVAAERAGTPLVSWDRELLVRAGAVTPERWLAESAAG